MIDSDLHELVHIDCTTQYRLSRKLYVIFKGGGVFIYHRALQRMGSSSPPKVVVGLALKIGISSRLLFIFFFFHVQSW